MKQTNRVTTITVEMSAREYEAIRLLSNRVREREEYMGGGQWFKHLEDILGFDYAETIANLTAENDEA